MIDFIYNYDKVKYIISDCLWMEGREQTSV